MMSPARRLVLTTALVLVAGACAPAAQPTATPAAPAKATTAASPKPAVSPAASPSPAAGGADAGKELVAAKGCGGCHTIPGCATCTGAVGPNLAGVASRNKIAGGAVDNNGPEDLKKWILDPPAAKPGTAMPKLGLSDDEATKIAAYLA